MNKQEQIEELAAENINLTRKLADAASVIILADERITGLNSEVTKVRSELHIVYRDFKERGEIITKQNNRIDWLVSDRNRILNNNIALKAKYNSEAARWSRAINNSKETMSNVLTLIDRASVRNRETKEATDALATELGKTQARASTAEWDVRVWQKHVDTYKGKLTVSRVFNVVLVMITVVVIVTARIATS